MLDVSLVLADVDSLSTKQISEKYEVSQRRIQQILKENGVFSGVRKPKAKKSDLIARGCVYKISIKGYEYIGQTTNLKQRMQVHCCDLRSGVHSCKMIQHLFALHPKETIDAFHKPNILLCVEKTTVENLLKYESEFIVRYAANGRKIVNGILGDVLLMKDFGILTV